MAPPQRGTSLLASMEGNVSMSEKGTIRVVSGSGYRFLSPFPFRLHKMLSDVEERGDSSIVSWMPDGLHFKVHNPKRFVEEIIPKAFKQKSLKSFQRQLHLYGFQRVQDGPNKGAYWHENFQQNNRELSLSISRIKAPKRRSGGQNTAKPEKKAPPSVARRTAQPAFALSTSERMVFPQSTLMGNVSPDQLTSTSSTTNGKSNQPLSDASVAETYGWLCSVGLPVSAFDPVALSEKFSVRTSATELLECADEITSLFATPAATPVKETRVAAAAATLDAPMPLSAFPADMTLPAPTDTTAVVPSASVQESMPVPEDLLFDAALPTIENDNWALW